MKPYQHKVHYYETDKMGIVHHSNYVRWMEEARIDFFSQIGWDYKELEESGIISPVTAIECKYKVSTMFSDVIEIEVWVEEFKGAKLRVGYEMKKADALVCKAYSEHCFMNAEGKFINMKKEYPKFFEALAALIKK